MKTAVSVPDALFEAAEAFAGRHNMTRSELYATALRRYLEERRGEGVTEKLDEIYGAEPESLDPQLARMQIRSLPKDEW